jgi:glycosyltransferase involved in cell wall biosynthesis
MVILIISPGLVEVPPIRIIGGIPEIDYRIGIQISAHYKTIITSPFYYKYQKYKKVNKNLKILYIYHPAINRSAKVNILRLSLETLSILISYTFQIIINIIKLKKYGLNLVILSDRYSGIIQIMICKLLKIKTIFSESNPYPWYSPFLIKRPHALSWGVNLSFGKLACKLADKIRTQSILIKRGMINYRISKDKIEIIPAGVDTNTFRPYNSDETNCVVGFLGRLTEEKGAGLLYDIMKTCEKELPEVKFIVLGSGPYEYMLKNLKNIAFQQTIPRNILPTFINKADMFVSTYYDFSLSDLEILSCGKPLIKINTPEMNKLFKNYEEIIFCDRDVKDFVNKIKLLYENKDLCKKIGERARKKVEKEFDWKVIGEQWIRLINSLLK